MTTELHVIEEFMIPILKPNVIDFKMIENAYWENAPKGEAGRLKRLDPFKVDKITEISLEFKNILKIDHLWVMPNLTKLSLNFNNIEKIENLDILINLNELNLSFNLIENIENLDNLRNLQILSLFNNKISKIENLDKLENLTILSIGNNLINTTKGIERLRFLKKLYSLSFEENPITQTDEFHNFGIFIAALLPQLKYYQYNYICDREREEGKNKYSVILQQTKQSEEDEINAREKFAKDLENEKKSSTMFVEYLNEHQLYESLFVYDKSGNKLRMIEEGIDEVNTEYKNDIYAITQKIYKLGLIKHEERMQEIEMYKKCVDEGIEKAQISGQEIVEEFEEFKTELFKEVTNILTELKKFQKNQNEDPIKLELEEKLEVLKIKINNKIDEIWKTMMNEEIHLFEEIEKVTVKFSKNITYIVKKFIEKIQMYFCQLREIATIYSEDLQNCVNCFIVKKVMCNRENEIPKELQDCIEDKNAIKILCEKMKYNHISKMNAREDRLVERTKDWLENLLEERKEKGIERNRDKIKEINCILNFSKEEFDDLIQNFTIEHHEEN